VEVPSKRIPYFKPSKELKDLVNGPEEQRGTAAEPAPVPETTPGS
jgi:integration host factor subunit beta